MSLYHMRMVPTGVRKNVSNLNERQTAVTHYIGVENCSQVLIKGPPVIINPSVSLTMFIFYVTLQFFTQGKNKNLKSNILNTLSLQYNILFLLFSFVFFDTADFYVATAALKHCCSQQAGLELTELYLVCLLVTEIKTYDITSDWYLFYTVNTRL